MRLILAIIFLIALPSTANAEWKFISKNQSGSLFYLDPTSVISSGNKKQFWILMDLPVPYKGIESFKRQIEIDCANRTSMGLFVIGFKNLKGQGQVLMNGEVTSEPTPISPLSIESDFYNLICTKNN